MHMTNNDEPIDPNEVAEEAKQSAHLPIYAPRAWFDAAGRPYTDGALAPFSSARKFAMQRLGVSRSSMESGATIVYLCLCTREAIDAARGTRWEGGKRIDAEAEFRRKVEEWADSIGMRFGDCPVTHDIGKIADEIWEREAASESQPDIPAGGKPSPNA